MVITGNKIGQHFGAWAFLVFIAAAAAAAATAADTTIAIAGTAATAATLTTDGAFATWLSCKAGWAVRRPPSFSLSQCMAIGSAGHTAMMYEVHRPCATVKVYRWRGVHRHSRAKKVRETKKRSKD